MRWIVAGGRDFSDRENLKGWLDHIRPSRIISGTAKGADSLGEEYAALRGIPVDRYPAQWDTHGKGAGFIRNVEMSENADAAICFWDGQSRGTKHMIDTALKKRLVLVVVPYA